MHFELKFQEILYRNPCLLYDLTEEVSTYCVTAMYRNGSHAFGYWVKIILVAPVRLCILKSSANQFAYHYTRREHRDNAHAKTGIFPARAVKRMFPSCTASAITRASTIPSIHSAIIFFA